ncbi:hypothetical protein [Rhodococcus koreensis]
MPELTIKEFEDILLAREIAELEMDIDATMDRCRRSHFELVGLGLRID